MIKKAILYIEEKIQFAKDNHYPQYMIDKLEEDKKIELKKVKKEINIDELEDFLDDYT